MAATGFGNGNVWKEIATEQERNFRFVAIMNVTLAFVLLATASYAYASKARMSSICGQIETVAASDLSGAKDISLSLLADYCS